jgi:hypothetical protein
MMVNNSVNLTPSGFVLDAEIQHRDVAFCVAFANGSHLSILEPCVCWSSSHFYKAQAISMSDIFRKCNVFKILDSVVCFVAVLVIYGHPFWARTNKLLGDQNMHSEPVKPSILLEANHWISSMIDLVLAYFISKMGEHLSFRTNRVSLLKSNERHKHMVGLHGTSIS